MRPRARAVMLLDYPAVARYVGLSPNTMLRAAGLHGEALQDPENWLPGDRALELLRLSAIKARRDDFGVLLGECRTFASLGPVSLLLRHELTLRDIMMGVIEYRRFINELFDISLSENGQMAMLQWNLIPGLKSVDGVNLLATIAYRVLVHLAGVKWHPECIHFREKEPRQISTFARVFGCALEFDSTFDGISFSASCLELRNCHADRELVVHAERLLNLLPGLRQRETVSERTRAALPFLISSGRSSIGAVAECLGLPCRTLQRRLEEEGSSYRRLLNDTRRDLATRYLGNLNRSVTEVALCTGFTSPSSFTRWFVAEFQVAPTRWRRAGEQ